MKTIILDFDGTMGDTRSLIVKTMQQTIAALGLPGRSDDQCASMIGLPLRETFTKLIPMSEAMGDLCDATYTRLFKENNVPGAVPVFPHVADTLAKLHARGHVLAVASSRRRQSLLDYMREMGIERFVSCVVSASDVERAKPAPDMVLKILDQTGGAASDALVVGDTRFDIEMGRSAGTKTCGVSYGNGSLEELSMADYVVDDFARLLDIAG